MHSYHTNDLSIVSFFMFQSKIRELEKKTELQNVRHEELLLELRAIKKSEGKSTADDVTSDGSWKRSSTNQEIQTSPDSNTSTPGKSTLHVMPFALGLEMWVIYHYYPA